MHQEQVQRSQAKKLWKRNAVHQKLKIQVLKLVVLRFKKQGSEKLMCWRPSEATITDSETNRILRHSRTDMISAQDWRTFNFKALSYPQEGIFVLYNVNLIHKWSVLRIVLSYYYYSKWLSDNSNSKVVELDFFTKDGRLQLSP